MIKTDNRPMVARLLNFCDAALRAIGARRAGLEPDALKAAATAATGLSDYGPSDFEEGLAVFCLSLEQDAKLDFVGRRFMRMHIERLLANRLLWVDLKKRHPEALETPLLPPLVIVGLPRTGSTFLQRVLAQDPAACALPSWRLLTPLPTGGQGDDEKRKLCSRAIEAMYRLVPSLKSKHYVGCDEPTECYHLLDPSFRAPSLSMFSAAEGFTDWSRETEMSSAYALYRDYLHILAAKNPDRRFVLKAPLHTPYMEELSKAIPSAMFVQTHRNPVEVAGSLASLVYSLNNLTTTEIDPHRIGDHTLRLMRWLVDASREQRARLGLTVVDVEYDQLVSDPIRVLRQIYAGHGLEWSAQLENIFVRAVADRPQHEHGRHTYELSDFGLCAEEVAREFAALAFPLTAA